MKKISTLITGLLFSIVLMAADHRPSLSIRSSKNYKIVIDGRSYFTHHSLLRINSLSRGYHTLKVYEMRKGYFGGRERLVNFTSFRMGRQDVRIRIDWFGQVSISTGNGRYDRNENRFDRDDEEFGDRERNFGPGKKDRMPDRNGADRNDKQTDDDSF